MIEQLSIGLVTFNHERVIGRTLRSLLDGLPANIPAHIWVLDNRSDDRTLAAVHEIAGQDSRVSVIASARNEGFASGNNRILEMVDSTYHVFCNPDITVTAGALDTLIDFLRRRPNVAIVCPRFNFEDGRLQPLNKRHPTISDLFLRRFMPLALQRYFADRMRRYEMFDFGYEHIYDVPFVSGAFMVCRTEILKTLGGFDARFFLYLEDADLSRQVQESGWRTVYVLMPWCCMNGGAKRTAAIGQCCCSAPAPSATSTNGGGALHEHHAVAFLGALLASAALVPFCRRAAFRFGYVAKPRVDRWHEQPTPFLGGVAVFLPVIVGIGLTGGWRHHAVLVTCAAMIAAVGFVDDVITLKPATKLIAQIVLASVLLLFGHRLYWVESMTLDSLLTIVWVVGITNAFNLLDNMDGLCAGIAIIAGTAFLAGLPSATPDSTLFYQGQYLALLLGAAAGFLIYNIHPATIFMGDTGSLFLGFSLAVMGLGSEPGHAAQPSLLSVISAPILVLVIPILDTTLVTLSRWLSGRAASTGGRDHSSHRLVAMGLSQQRAVAVLWSLAAITALTGYFARSLETSWSVLLILAVLLPLTVFTVYLGNVRVYDDADISLLRRKGVTPLVVTFMYKRRVAEVFLDLALISVAYYTAYRLRFEGPEFEVHFREFLGSLPIVIAAQLIALFIIGAYRGVWHLFGLIDTVVFAKAVFLGTGTAALAVLLINSNYSRTVFVIYGALLFLLLSVSRASFRLIGEFVTRRRQIGERLVIYGAGAAALVAMREVGAGRQPYRVLGYIDDDPNKHRSRVHGYLVLGGFEKLTVMLRRDELDAVLVSCKTLAGEREKELLALTAAHGCRLKRLHVSIKEVGDAGSEPQRVLPRIAARDR